MLPGIPEPVAGYFISLFSIKTGIRIYKSFIQKTIIINIYCINVCTYKR